jgi:hypothetical protein
MTSVTERRHEDEAQADAEFRERMRRVRRAVAILGGGRPHEPAATFEEGLARIRAAAARLRSIRA